MVPTQLVRTEGIFQNVPNLQWIPLNSTFFNLLKFNFRNRINLCCLWGPQNIIGGNYARSTIWWCVIYTMLLLYYLCIKVGIPQRLAVYFCRRKYDEHVVYTASLRDYKCIWNVSRLASYLDSSPYTTYTYIKSVCLDETQLYTCSRIKIKKKNG